MLVLKAWGVMESSGGLAPCGNVSSWRGGQEAIVEGAASAAVETPTDWRGLGHGMTIKSSGSCGVELAWVKETSCVMWMAELEKWGYPSPSESRRPRVTLRGIIHEAFYIVGSEFCFALIVFVPWFNKYITYFEFSRYPELVDFGFFQREFRLFKLIGLCCILWYQY